MLKRYDLPTILFLAGIFVIAYSVSFWEFVKMGLPFAVAATAAGSAVIWAFWH